MIIRRHVESIVQPIRSKILTLSLTALRPIQVDLCLAARYSVRFVEHCAAFPAGRIEDPMSIFSQIYLWFMQHASAPFGLIWTTITATAIIVMTLSIREKKGTTPQIDLVPPRHIGALITLYTNRTYRGEGREPRAAIGFGSFRLNFPTVAFAGLLVLFLASYIAIILVWDDFASADNDLFIWALSRAATFHYQFSQVLVGFSHSACKSLI